MPSAPPNSEQVSITAEAEPARSGATAPTTDSVTCDITITRPAASSPAPVSTPDSDHSARTWVRTTYPDAASTNPAPITYARSILPASTEASGAAIATPTDGASDHSAAVSGLSPCTSCRYCVMNTAFPTSASEATVLAASEPLNARLRNIPSLSIGALAVRCRCTNSTPNTSPATIATTGNIDTPFAASSLIPQMIGSTAVSDSTDPSRSNRPATGALNSGSSTGASTSSRTIAGVLIRNTEPHQKCSSRNPPSTGPMVMPPISTALQNAIAFDRCAGSWNMFRISASVDGIRVAPPMPSTARATINCSGFCAYAAATEATPKPIAPNSSSRRRPIRSPSEPMVISRPASTNP